MNPEAYERLPAEFQAIVDEVLGPSAGRRLAKALERDVALGRDYMRAGGVTLIELGPKERKAFDAAVEPVITKTLAKLAAQGLPAQEVYDFLKASVKRALSDMRPEAQVT